MGLRKFGLFFALSMRAYPTARNLNALYRTARWRRLRAEHLAQEPLCRYCTRLGLVNDGSPRPPTAAKWRPGIVVDHVRPHRGDLDLFWAPGNLQTLCAWHHDFRKRREEQLGFHEDLDADGLPEDRAHPSWRPLDGGEPAWTGQYGIPRGLPPFTANVIYVYGPPAAGKSAWIAERMAAGDRHVEFSQCAADAGLAMAELDRDGWIEASALWRFRLRECAALEDGVTYIERVGGHGHDSVAWRNALGPEARTHCCYASLATCRRRLRGRQESGELSVLEVRKLLRIARRWHALPGDPPSVGRRRRFG